MKTLLLSIAMMPVALAGSGQEQAALTSGRITYEEKVRLEIRLEGETAQFAQNLPKERKSEKILAFANDMVLYQDGTGNAEDEIIPQHAEGQVKIRIAGGGENKLYMDLSKNLVTEQRDFMNRLFIVENQIPKADWKVTGNQKKILGYDCYEAVRQDTGHAKTIAWFAPGIPVKAGPAGLCNLPGMVLEANLDDGSRTYTAKSVEAVTRDLLKIQKPKDGKKVSEEEYKTIVADKMKEMGVEGTQGGNQVRIVIRHQ